MAALLHFHLVFPILILTQQSKENMHKVRAPVIWLNSLEYLHKKLCNCYHVTNMTRRSPKLQIIDRNVLSADWVCNLCYLIPFTITQEHNSRQSRLDKHKSYQSLFLNKALLSYVFNLCCTHCFLPWSSAFLFFSVLVSISMWALTLRQSISSEFVSSNR